MIRLTKFLNINYPPNIINFFVEDSKKDGSWLNDFLHLNENFQD